MTSNFKKFLASIEEKRLSRRQELINRANHAYAEIIREAFEIIRRMRGWLPADEADELIKLVESQRIARGEELGAKLIPPMLEPQLLPDGRRRDGIRTLRSGLIPAGAVKWRLAYVYGFLCRRTPDIPPLRGGDHVVTEEYVPETVAEVAEIAPPKKKPGRPSKAQKLLEAARAKQLGD